MFTYQLASWELVQVTPSAAGLASFGKWSKDPDESKKIELYIVFVLTIV